MLSAVVLGCGTVNGDVLIPLSETVAVGITASELIMVVEN